MILNARTELLPEGRCLREVFIFLATRCYWQCTWDVKGPDGALQAGAGQGRFGQTTQGRMRSTRRFGHASRSPGNANVILCSVYARS